MVSKQVSLLSFFAIIFLLDIESTFGSLDEFTEPTINGLSFKAAIDEKIVSPYFCNLSVEDNLTLKYGEQPDYKKILLGFYLQTTAQGRLWVYTENNQKTDVILSLLDKESVLSDIISISPDGKRTSLYEDTVALGLLKNQKFLPGIICPVYSAPWGVKLSATNFKMGAGTIHSRSKIKITSDTVEFEDGVWFRTPTGIEIKPKNETNSLIKYIRVVPWLFSYEYEGKIQHSWTCNIRGKIDFSKLILDLHITNAQVSILFDKDVFPDFKELNS